MQTADMSHVPFVVVDVETTGVNPRQSRVVEIAAVLVHGEYKPRVLLDTLVDSGGALRGTDVHGITPEDLVGAPSFEELIQPIRAILANRVLVAHNAAFDVASLTAEFDAFACEPLRPPVLCTMRLPRPIELGAGNWPLWWACLRGGVRHDEGQHHALADALATAHLLRSYIVHARERGITRLSDVSRRGRFFWGETAAFSEMLDRAPLPSPPVVLDRSQFRQKPRIHAAPPSALSPAQQYMAALVTAVSDLVVTDVEHRDLASLAQRLRLSPQTIAKVHSKVYEGALARYLEDGVFDPVERAQCERLVACLATLGWQPPADPSGKGASC